MWQPHLTKLMHYDPNMAASHPSDSDGRGLILLGAGGHARVVLDLALLLDREVLGLLDDNPALKGKVLDGSSVLDRVDALCRFDPERVALVNAVGSTGLPTERAKLFERGVATGFVFATLVHPSAVVSRSAVLGAGVGVLAGAIIGPAATLGEDVLINTRASVDHDCRVGPHTHLAPGVTLCGGVRIGEGCHVGSGATIIQGITIGANVLVAAGAVVTRDIPDGQRVAGVPAKAF